MAELAATLGGPRARLVAVERSVFRRRVAPHAGIVVSARRTRVAAGGFSVHASVTGSTDVAAWAILRFEDVR